MNFLAVKNCIILIQFLFAFQAIGQIYPTHADVDYTGDRQERQLLDVYIPPGTETPRPAVVYIHGGGWKNGSKLGELRPELRRLYDRAEYIIIDINYRYSLDTIWPAQLYDCKTAIRYLRRHADLYHIDSCAIGVVGYSSGGHLAAIMGTTNGIDSLAGHHLGYRDLSSDVQAVVDFFGPTDFMKADDYYPVMPPDSCNDAIIYDEPESFVSQLLGCHISDCPERVRSANPMTYIDGSDPPIRIYHGTFDCTVPFYQSQIFFESLILAGVPTDFVPVQSAVHADPIFYSTPAVNGMTNFFMEHLSRAACYQIPTPNDSIIKTDLDVFPNPASDFLFINFHSTAMPISVEIIDINGHILTTSNAFQIDVKGLSKGMYFINVILSNQIITKRFVKM